MQTHISRNSTVEESRLGELPAAKQGGFLSKRLSRFKNPNRRATTDTARDPASVLLRTPSLINRIPWLGLNRCDSRRMSLSPQKGCHRTRHLRGSRCTTIPITLSNECVSPKQASPAANRPWRLGNRACHLRRLYGPPIWPACTPVHCCLPPQSDICSSG